MTRGRIVLLFAGLVGLALLAGLVFRLPLSEAAVETALRVQGFAEPRLTVSELGWRRAVLQDVAIGPGPDIVIGRLEVTYSLDGLVDRRLDRVTVVSARLGMIATGDGVLVHGLPERSAAPEADMQVAVPVDEILLRDVRIVAATPVGPVTADLGGRLRPSSDRTGLAAELDWTVTSDHGSADGRLSAQSQGTDSLEAELTVAEGRIRAPFANARDLAGSVTANVAQGRLVGAGIDLAAGTVAAQTGDPALDGLSGTLAVSGQYRDDLATLTVILNEGADAAALSLDATVETPLSAPAWQAAGRVLLTARSALWSGLALTPPESGQTTVTFDARGTMAEDWRQPEARSLAAVLSRHSGMADITLVVRDVTHADIGQRLSGDMELDAELGNGALTMRWPGRAQLRLASLSPALFDPASLPAEWRPPDLGAIDVALRPRNGKTPTLTIRPAATHYRLELDSGLSLSTAGGLKADADASGHALLDGQGAVQAYDFGAVRADISLSAVPALRGATLAAKGSLSGQVEALNGNLRLQAKAGQVRLPSLTAEGADLRLPLAVERQGNTVTLRLTEDGRLSLSGLVAADRLALEGGADLTLKPAHEPAVAVTWPVDAAGAPSARLALSLHGDALDLHVRQDDRPPLQIGLHGVDTQLSARAPAGRTPSADTEVSVADLTLPGYALAAGPVTIQAKLRDSGRQADLELRAQQVRHRAKPSLFAPVAVSADAARTGDSVTFVASVRDGQAAQRLTAKGSYDLDSGRGAATLHLPTLSFAPQALQPKALLPPLADLEAVSGRISGDAQFAIAPDGLSGTAQLQIAGLGFALGGLTLSGLDTALRLTSLSPLISAPDQKLTIATLDSVTSVSAIDVRYRLEPGPGGRPLVRIDRFSAKLFDGAVSSTGMRADPTDGRLTGDLAVQGLSLEKIMALIGAEGVTGTGALSGTIPLAVADGTLTVSGGTLVADGGGTLRIPSDQVAQAIGSGNEDLALVARVLEDFRYQELSMRIDKQAEGDGQVRLSLLGHNPAVLDGHPFQFNINLSSNVDDLLAALLEAYGGATEAMNRALENLR